MKKSTSKKGTAFFRGFLPFLLLSLLFLCGLSTHAVFARFITKNSLSDKARIAFFAVCASEEETLPHTYCFSVSNKNEAGISEVSIAFDVAVTFPDGLALPDEVQMVLSCENFLEKSFLKEERNGKVVYIFQEAGIFPAGMETQLHFCLKFSATGTLSETLTFHGVTVEIIARQITEALKNA